MHGERILITGGAGFIGSRLARALAAAGAEILAFDNLHPQVHGDRPLTDPSIPLVRGDVRDRPALQAALHEFRPTIVVHLAAETGTGQSADEPTRYAEVNVVGTAHLIEVMRTSSQPPRRVVLAATRAVYGEGAYLDAAGRLVVPRAREVADMEAGRFGLFGDDGSLLTPVPTPEHVPLAPASVYGSTKLMQEYLLQQTPSPWGSIMLRLQNVYGPGQSLRNPYTGVLSIFCQQAMRGKVLNIYEDGDIHRDFVYVDDVVSAFVAACRSDRALGRVMNVGTGERTSIRQAADKILFELGLPAERLAVTGAFRAGDVRHAVADNSLATTLLEWTPRVSFSTGVAELVKWAKREAVDGVKSEESR
jgi:dTDP-L-rhamnose 4-epimerase